MIHLMKPLNSSKRLSSFFSPRFSLRSRVMLAYTKAYTENLSVNCASLARKYLTGTLHVDDGLMFFSSCNIRAFYTRENKPRLTLTTVYKIRKRNYLYEYIFPGQYKPRLEKDVNVDFVPFYTG